MTNEMKHFTDRFTALFGNGGLMNVKFFVRDADNMKLSEFVVEATKIQDTIAAGAVKVVHSIDGDFEQRRFDAPF